MKWLLLSILVFGNGDQFVTMSMIGGTYDSKYKCELADQSLAWSMGQGAGGKLTDIPGFQHEHKVCVKLGK